MSAVKTVGASGQISLGKQYAGKNVLVEKIEPGVWVVKIGEFIPDSEKWLHQPDIEKNLNEAVAWAETNPPNPIDLDNLEKSLGHE